MGRSQESWNKREKEKQRVKKREDKDKKKAERKANSDKGGDFDDMIAYVDEFGMISSTPPDPNKKKEKIIAADIEIGIPKKEDMEPEDLVKRGVVTFFDQSKGFGFIKVANSADSIFVHIKSCVDPIKEGDKVVFETENSPRGVNATGVKLDVA